jgi:hypothetical protein
VWNPNSWYPGVPSSHSVWDARIFDHAALQIVESLPCAPPKEPAPQKTSEATPQQLSRSFCDDQQHAIINSFRLHQSENSAFRSPGLPCRRRTLSAPVLLRLHGEGSPKKVTIQHVFKSESSIMNQDSIDGNLKELHSALRKISYRLNFRPINSPTESESLDITKRSPSPVEPLTQQDFAK